MWPWNTAAAQWPCFPDDVIALFDRIWSNLLR